MEERMEVVAGTVTAAKINLTGKKLVLSVFLRSL